MGPRKYFDVLDAVDNKKAEHRGRKHLAQEAHLGRRLFSRRKNPERQKASNDRPQNHHTDRNDLLRRRHACSPAFSIGFAGGSAHRVWRASKERQISRPKTKDTAATAQPQQSAQMILSFSHCSINMTVNIAVITKPILRVEGDYRAEKAAQSRAGKPVEVIEQRDEKHEPSLSTSSGIFAV